MKEWDFQHTRICFCILERKGEAHMKKMSKKKKAAGGIAGAVVLAAGGAYMGVS